MATEACRKAEKGAVKEKAREVIEVEDNSLVKAEEVDDVKMEGSEEEEEEEDVVFIEKKGVGGAGMKNRHRHKIGAAVGTKRTAKTLTSPVKKTNLNKRMQVAQMPERMQGGTK